MGDRSRQSYPFLFIWINRVFMSNPAISNKTCFDFHISKYFFFHFKNVFFNLFLQMNSSNITEYSQYSPCLRELVCCVILSADLISFKSLKRFRTRQIIWMRWHESRIYLVPLTQRSTGSTRRCIDSYSRAQTTWRSHMQTGRNKATQRQTRTSHTNM